LISRGMATMAVPNLLNPAPTLLMNFILVPPVRDEAVPTMRGGHRCRER
jgi:hypothetical protein